MEAILKREMDIVDRLQEELENVPFLFNSGDELDQFKSNILMWTDEKKSIPALSVLYSYPGIQFLFCLNIAIIRLNNQFITNSSVLNASPSTPLSFLCSLYVFIATTSDVVNYPELQRLLVIVKDLSKTSNLYNLTRYSFVFLILFIQYAQTPIDTNPTLDESILLILKIGMMLNATAVMHSVHRIRITSL